MKVVVSLDKSTKTNRAVRAFAATEEQIANEVNRLADYLAKHPELGLVASIDDWRPGDVIERDF